MGGYGSPPGYGGSGGYAGSGGYGPPPGYGGYGPPPGYGGSVPQGYGGSVPQGYGGYGMYQPPRNDGTAIAALVLAITSFVVCPVVTAIVALALIPGSRRRIESSGGAITGLGLLTAAKIIAIIHLALAAIFIVAIVILSATNHSNNSWILPLGVH